MKEFKRDEGVLYEEFFYFTINLGIILAMIILLGIHFTRIPVVFVIVEVLWLVSGMIFGIKYWLPLVKEGTDNIRINENSILVQRAQKDRISLTWDEIQEVGLRLWDVPLMGTRMVRVYLYCSAQKLSDQERMKIGTYFQHDLSVKDVVYLNCKKTCREYGFERYQIDKDKLSYLPKKFSCAFQDEYFSQKFPCIYSTGSSVNRYSEQQVAMSAKKIIDKHKRISFFAFYDIFIGAAILALQCIYFNAG